MKPFNFFLAGLILLFVSGVAFGAPKVGNGKIAFVTNDNISITNADGTHRIRLTESGGWQPAFSADGEKIVYLDLAKDLAISVMNADGSEKICLMPGDGTTFNPSFSPDGKKIIYRGDDGICVMDADGTHQTKLGVGGLCPCYSPDGKKIAFAGGRVVLVNSDGTEATNLTSDLNAVTPCFSPDGKQIAFSTIRPSGDSIYIMNIDGTRLRCVTKNPRGKDIPNEYGDSGLCFSPDGKRILFTSTRNNIREIYTVDVNGKHEKRMINTPESFGPSWIGDVVPEATEAKIPH